MTFKYRMFNAPSPHTIDRAVDLGCNWVIVHSAGIEGPTTDPATGRDTDMFPIYFEDYPKVAEARRYQDSGWLEPLRREVAALCKRTRRHGLKVALHMYEPVLPVAFTREYPELVGVWKRPTQAGTVEIHSHLDPDNPATWELIRSKYAELAREFPLMDMAILSTWDGAGSYWCIPRAKMPIHRHWRGWSRPRWRASARSGPTARSAFGFGAGTGLANCTSTATGSSPRSPA